MEDYVYILESAGDPLYFIRRKDGNYNCFTKKGEIVCLLIIENEMAYVYNRNSICVNAFAVSNILELLK